MSRATAGWSNGPILSADPVIVCGAGAGGIAAALTAARSGAEVLLVEAGRAIGGTVTHALIHTLAGLHTSSGELINGGLPEELIRRLKAADRCVRERRMGRVWVLQAAPETYRHVVEEWIASEDRIAVLCEHRVSRVKTQQGRVIEVDVEGDHVETVRPRAVIDATGTGAFVRKIDPALVEDDARRAAGGLIFTLRGVAPGVLEFPKGAGIIRTIGDAVESGTLPVECRHAWLDVGTRPDEVYVKLFVPVAGSDERRARSLAARMRDATVQLLCSLPGFEHANVGRSGILGIRDGGRLRGEYRLSKSDVLNGRRFADAACRCCWPIEYWDPEHGLMLEHLSQGSFYEVPLRALTPKGCRNVWTAGKCLSADRYAQASARVVGSCWAMGEAVGRAAASPAVPRHCQDTVALAPRP